MKHLFTRIVAAICLTLGYAYAQDATVTQIITLDLSCNIFGTGDTLEVQYSNLSSTPIANVSLGFSVTGGGGTVTSETGAPLSANGTNSHTFATLLTVPTSGVFTLKIWTEVVGDTDPTNDTLEIPINAPGLATLPFSEDFETFTPQLGPTDPGGLANGWTRFSTAGAGWFVANGPTSSGNTGPNSNHTPGGSIFVFTEASIGGTGTEYRLFTPCIDLGGANAPRLSFWYHMFGSNMGSLEVSVIENGVTTLVWSLAGQQQSSSSEDWREAIVDLGPYAGSIVQLEFKGIRGNGFRSDIAIDDVFLFDPAPVDASPVFIDQPLGPGCYGTNEIIDVTIQNLGSLPIDFSIDPLTITVEVNGPNGLNSYNTVVTNGTVGVLDSTTIEVTTSADLSLVGNYTLTAYTSATNDPNAFNDTTASAAEKLNTLAGAFTEDFETGVSGFPGTLPAGWSRTPSVSPTWHINLGSTSTFNTGPDNDHTPIGSIYAYAEMDNGSPGDVYELVSPCLDISGLLAPKLQFWYHMFGAGMGSLEVAIRTTSGTTTIWSISGQQQNSSNADYLDQILDLTSFQQDVIQVVFRAVRGASTQGDIAIDDINIFEPPAIDVALAPEVLPESGCGLSDEEPVIIQIANVGTDTLTNVVATYSINNNPFVNLETITTPIPPGDTLVYTFTALADFSVAGFYDLKLTATQIAPVADPDPSNDTIEVTIFSLGAVVNTFPYFEDFESGPGNWQSLGTNSSWAFGTPNKNTISGASSGQNAWVTGGLGFGLYNANENSEVRSPCIDLTNLQNPVIKLDIWWEADWSFDGAVLQSSVDGGITWQNVGNLNDPLNWYNDNTISGNPGGQQIGWTGDGINPGFGQPGSNGWVTAENELTGLGGQSAVLLRVAFGSTAFTNDDGFAFDNILIYERPDLDADAFRVESPSGGCGYNDSTIVTVSYVNEGLIAFDSALVSYQVNAGTVVSEWDFTTVQPGDTAEFTFTTTTDMSNLTINYDLQFWVEVPGDTIVFNDSALNILIPVSIPTVTTYPYIENFETGQNGWNSGGVNNTWAFGTPNKQTISGAASGVNAWVTGGLGLGQYASDENSFVIGPCMDMSGLNSPVIEFSIWWEADWSADGAVLQSSTDGGLTWQNVGNFNDPDNWFNDNTIFGNPGGQQIGWTGDGINPGFGQPGSNGWVTAKNFMPNLAGEPLVRLRVAFGASSFTQDDGFAFDDIFVYDQPTEDFAADGFQDVPLSICNNDSVEIILDITNSGTLPQSNVPVIAIVDGPGGTFVLNDTINSTLTPGNSTTVNFGFFENIVGGTYNLTGYAVLAGDTTLFNDTTLVAFDINEINVTPVATSDSFCSDTGATFMLTSTNPGNFSMLWYDAPTGGNLVHIGDTFNTPTLFTSTPYYVETSSAQFYQVGAPNNGIGPGFHQTGFTGNGLRFEVYEELILESVRVYPEFGSSGNIQIVLFNGFTQAQTITVPFGGSVPDTVINLNWEIQPGTNYRLEAGPGTFLGGGGLFRNSNGANFPYTVPGLISITGNSNNFVNAYYFFYDWQIRSLGCPSPRAVANATVLPPADVDLGFDGVYCGPQTLIVNDPNLVDYDWYQNFDSVATGPSYTVDSSGVVFVEVTNTSGCVDRDTVVLTINPAPPAFAGVDSASCDPILLEADSVPGASYFWFSPVPQNQDSTNLTYLATETSVYILTVNALGCTNTDTVNITIYPSPEIGLEDEIASCGDLTIDAGSNGISYLWSTGDTTQTIMVTPPLTGSDTISVVVENNLGCVNNDTVLVRQGAEPDVDLGIDIVSCDPVQLDAGNPGMTFEWNTGETTQTITADQSGTYTVTVTSIDECIGTDAIDVSVLGNPQAGASYSNPTNGFTVNFFEFSTPDTGMTYLWSFGDGSGNTSTQANPVYTYQFSGTYPVTLIVSNACGSDTVEILVSSVGIDAGPLERKLSVSPNPTEGEFFIIGKELNLSNLIIEVSDVRGKTVYFYEDSEVNGDYSKMVDLHDQPAGVYLVRLSDGIHEMYYRIIRK